MTRIPSSPGPLCRRDARSPSDADANGVPSPSSADPRSSEESVLVCYCLDISMADLRRDMDARGDTSIPERIAVEIRAGRCACEVKNPEGSCCLGRVWSAVRRIRSERLAEACGNRIGIELRDHGPEPRKASSDAGLGGDDVESLPMGPIADREPAERGPEIDESS